MELPVFAIWPDCLADRGLTRRVRPELPILARRMMTCYDDCMRTIIDIPPKQLSALDSWSRARGISRAEAVRQAVACLLAAEDERPLAVDRTAGLWRDRERDGLAAQEALRAEWDER
jgi:hypothetical protein